MHTDSDKFPAIADAQAPFAYLRLMRSEADCATGYPPQALAPGRTARAPGPHGPPARDAFVFFINGAKERAPAAAMA